MINFEQIDIGTYVTIRNIQVKIMLDINKLSSIPLLCQNGWKKSHKVDIKKIYEAIECHSGISPQVPYKDIFSAAKEIIESLDGICIKNFHTELGFGKNSHIIEFNYFEYDVSVIPELQIIHKQIGKQALFIGSGYDIIGDWLVDEDGKIYFRDNIRDKLHWMSSDICQFLEQDIYNLTDKEGQSIFSK